MRRTLFGIVGLALAVGACSGADGAEYHLRVGHDQTAGHPYHLALERLADQVGEATEGAVRISIFPAAQLGDSAEQIEGLYLGSLDMALAAFPHAAQFCPELGVFGVPFLFEDEEHFAAVFDGEIGTVLDEACNERYSIRLLSTFTSGYRVLFNGRRPVESADDLSGLRIRVMGGEADALTWQALGAQPYPMRYSEVYSALQAGVIDGAENEPVSTLANRFYETAPHLAVTNHLVLPLGLFISERRLQGLPEPYREALRSAAHEAALWQREYMTERNVEALEEMRDRFGVQVTEPDVGELRERSLHVQEQVAERLGFPDLLAAVRAVAR